MKVTPWLTKDGEGEELEVRKALCTILPDVGICADCTAAEINGVRASNQAIVPKTNMI